MNEHDEDFASGEDYEVSESGGRAERSNSKPMQLRPRRLKKVSQYSEYEEPMEDSNEEVQLGGSLRARRSGRAKQTMASQQNEIDQELDRMDTEYEQKLIVAGDLIDQEEEEEFGVFNPAIDQILWRRRNRSSSDGEFEYLVKLKDYSYLHCEWIGEEEVVSLGKFGKGKLNRFNKVFDQRIEEKEVDPEAEDAEYFDPSYIKVDKILYAAEIFPVIHSKKANEIKGKWSELLSVVLSKLLNYAKDHVHYGVFFMEPVNPEKDNCPDYKRVVQHPIDLGTLSNRVYLNFYRCFADIWRDIGYVFKNCRMYNVNDQTDVRILGDTLREYAKILYKRWYSLQLEKYNSLVDEIVEKQREHIEAHPEDRENVEKEILEETDGLLKTLFGLLDRGIEAIERSEVERSDRELLKTIKMQFSQEISVKASLLGEDSQVLSQIFRDLERVFSFSLGLEVAKVELNRLKSFILDTINSNQQALIQKRFEAFLITSLNLLTSEEIQMFHPGDYSLNWVKDNEDHDVDNEEFVYFEDHEIESVDLLSPVDKAYLVKWANMSYLDTTWELESLIYSDQHIKDFLNFNRSQDKESRNNYLGQLSRHRNLLELMNNPKKKAKTPYQTVNEYKNKLYNLDIAKRDSLFQYTQTSQFIFKHKQRLRSYQIESVNWLIQNWYNGRNVILADEMGLGKTIQSIAFLYYLFSFQNMKGPFLVVAPLSTLQHWKRTVEEWTPMNCVLYYDVNGHEGRSACRLYEWYSIDVSVKGAIVKTNELCKFNILITSFEVFLQDYKDILLNLPIQHIIIDEAHRLKNQNAKILTALKKLPCPRILLLTGTPIQNNTAELWTLLNFIEPTQFYSNSKFLAEYGDVSKADQVDKLHQALRPYLLRRMKEDVEKSIPPLQETIIDIEMTNIQKTIYKALYENNKGMLMKGSGFNFNTSLNNLEMQLRKCCNHPFLMKEIQSEMTKDCLNEAEYIEKLVSSSGKMILIDKLLAKIMSENGKVLIFSQFTYMLILIEEYLKHKFILFEKIDGSVKAKERQNSIDRFNSNTSKSPSVFLLSTKAGGVGINLTSANYVIIFDSDWNPQNDVQATARAHRIGQENEVKVYRLITKKTYESEMFERASKKLGLDQAIFLGGAFHSTTDSKKSEDDNLKKLSKTEIEILLKKGIMGLLEGEGENGQAMQDIDEILKNSRIAKYSLINGTYTFSKSSFAGAETDRNLQMDDPNFWSIVFKNSESEFEKLVKSYNEKEAAGGLANLDEQKKVMEELSRLFNKLIESKIRVEGYSIDDENNLNEILTNITTHLKFHKHFKDVAHQMIAEIQKPSRRCKNIDINKLDISLNMQRSKPMKRAVVARERAEGDEDGEEEDNIYKEGSDDETNNIFEQKADVKPKEKVFKRRPTAALKNGNETNGKGKSHLENEINEKKQAKSVDGGKENSEPTKKKKRASEKETEVGAGNSQKVITKSRISQNKNGESTRTKSANTKENSKSTKPTRKSQKRSNEDKDTEGKKPKTKVSKGGAKDQILVNSDSTKSQNGNGLQKTLPQKTVPQFTYSELNIDPPSSVDFSTFKKSWCRYCGARFSSKFCSGPWGHDCLCFMHFEMHRKKQLKLNKKEYPELSAPIDIDKNSELDYFSELGSLEKIYQMINSKMRNLDVSSNKR